MKDRNQVCERVNALLKQKRTMIEYMGEKKNEHDWHGVQDAASDLRDIEAELKGLQWVLNGLMLWNVEENRVVMRPQHDTSTEQFGGVEKMTPEEYEAHKRDMRKRGLLGEASSEEE